MTELIPYNHDKAIKNIKPLIHVCSDSFANDFDDHFHKKYCNEYEIGHFKKLVQPFRLEKFNKEANIEYFKNNSDTPVFPDLGFLL